MKLKLNSSYSVYTKLAHVSGAKILVTGIINYNEVLNYPPQINLIAINEKVINPDDSVSSDKYLRNQVYYLCKYINDPEKILIIWDDVIDTNKTTRLNVDYNYKLKLSINQDFEGSIEDVISEMESLLFQTYGTQLTTEFVNTSVKSNKSEDADAENSEDSLAYYREVLGEAMTVVQKIASLKQIETAIDMFVKGEFNNKMESLINQIAVLQEAVSTISSVIL